jgi:hypothetical protein
MSIITNESRYLYDVKLYLEEFINSDTSVGLDRDLNSIFLKFADDMGCRDSFEENYQPEYDGDFDPLYYNAELIQSKWEDFSNWLMSNYSKNLFSNN